MTSLCDIRELEETREALEYHHHDNEVTMPTYVIKFLLCVLVAKIIGKN